MATAGCGGTTTTQSQAVAHFLVTKYAPETLCEIARAGLSFIVPLRADSGFRERYLDDVGPKALRALDYVSASSAPATAARFASGSSRPRERRAGEALGRLRALLRGAARGRRGPRAALVKAEEALGRVKRGLGGRYYKTRAQVDKRVARLVGPKLEPLLRVKTRPARGAPRSAGSATKRRSMRPRGPTASTRSRPSCLGASRRPRCYASTKTSRSSSATTATSSRHSGSARSFSTGGGEKHTFTRM